MGMQIDLRTLLLKKLTSAVPDSADVTLGVDALFVARNIANVEYSTAQ
jgi:hypothetical protein